MPKVPKSAPKGAKGLQKGAKMEARDPPETTPKGLLTENGEIYENISIYYVLATSGSVAKPPFRYLWACKSEEKQGLRPRATKRCTKAAPRLQKGRP